MIWFCNKFARKPTFLILPRSSCDWWAPWAWPPRRPGCPAGRRSCGCAPFFVSDHSGRCRCRCFAVVVVVVVFIVIVQHLDDADHLKSFLIMPKKISFELNFFKQKFSCYYDENDDERPTKPSRKSSTPSYLSVDFVEIITLEKKHLSSFHCLE